MVCEVWVEMSGIEPESWLHTIRLSPIETIHPQIINDDGQFNVLPSTTGYLVETIEHQLSIHIDLNPLGLINRLRLGHLVIVFARIQEDIGRILLCESCECILE